MKVAQFGLGRLGLPVAAVLSQYHDLIGVDPDPNIEERLTLGHPWEAGLSDYLGKIRLGTPGVALRDAEVGIVCVQTPHDPELDGTRVTDRREPFDTSFLERAIAQIGGKLPVIIMSTVLPGTCRRLSDWAQHLVYSPAFPAMGSVISDLLDPEFTLAGTEDGSKATIVEELWRPVLGRKLDVISTTWETAELGKLAYNTFVGLKLAAANTTAWMAEEVGADGGEVMEIIAKGTRRITSDAYLKPGLGDGGACHSRDAYAMSWLARQNGVWDFYSVLVDQRVEHSAWIAQIARRAAAQSGLPVVILGSAYKAESTLTDGSPALLLADQTGWPVVETVKDEAEVVVIGIPHERYKSFRFAPGSIILDPWGVIPAREGVRLLRPGRSPL